MDLETIESYKDKLNEKIRYLNETIWEHKIAGKVERWLNNFEDDKERINSLFLLSQFMYFGSHSMRELLKSLFRDLYKYHKIEQIRLRNSNTINLTFINEQFNIELNNTRFLGVGNPSESGTHLLYFFRQENQLSKKLFIDAHEIFKYTNNKKADGTVELVRCLENENITEYVFLDDFCGSGSQAKKYNRTIVNDIKSINPDIRVSYIMLFSTKNGKDIIKKSTQFDYVEAIFELDESFKCFSESSRYFKKQPDFITKEECLSICEKYGKPQMKNILEKEVYDENKLDIVVEKNKFGFGDCQLLLGFHHNTPDNTLPIFWYDEDKIWSPIFRRYNKIYS